MKYQFQFCEFFSVMYTRNSTLRLRAWGINFPRDFTRQEDAFQMQIWQNSYFWIKGANGHCARRGAQGLPETKSRALRASRRELEFNRALMDGRACYQNTILYHACSWNVISCLWALCELEFFLMEIGCIGICIETNLETFSLKEKNRLQCVCQKITKDNVRLNISIMI